MTLSLSTRNASPTSTRTIQHLTGHLYIACLWFQKSFDSFYCSCSSRCCYKCQTLACSHSHTDVMMPHKSCAGIQCHRKARREQGAAHRSRTRCEAHAGQRDSVEGTRTRTQQNLGSGIGDSTFVRLTYDSWFGVVLWCGVVWCVCTVCVCVCVCVCVLYFIHSFMLISSCRNTDLCLHSMDSSP